MIGIHTSVYLQTAIAHLEPEEQQKQMDQRRLCNTNIALTDISSHFNIIC